jgi:hypothetical protein
MAMPDEFAPFPSGRATPIFTSPQGLQGFLGTKAVGQNPDRLAGTVTPEIDLGPFWRANFEWKFVGRTDAVTVRGITGSTAAFTVPAGKFWVPLFHSVIGYGGAGDTIDVVPALLRTQASAVDPVASWSDTSQAGGSQLRLSMVTWPWWQFPTIFGPGWGFTALCRFVTLAVAPQCDVRLTYIELDG